MKPLSAEELKELVSESQSPCVSIYLPTHRAGVETQQDHIRLKNLLGEAELRLTVWGMRRSEARELLDRAWKLVTDNPFWQHQLDSLALFINKAMTRAYRIPLKIDELVAVGEAFHVKPLFPLFQADGRFYLLALSKDEVRFLAGSRYDWTRLETKSAPRNFGDYMKWVETERQIQHHTSIGPTTGGGKRAMFHGHGGGSEDIKAELRQYLQMIDQGLSEHLARDRSPLVLAGVDYMLSLYREINSYKYLADDMILGNPEGLSDEELHARSWRIVLPFFEQEQQKAAREFRELMGTGRASSNINEILPAAHQGRVDRLFVATGAAAWGSFDPLSGEVQVSQNQEIGTRDLLDLAAAETFMNRGKVYAVAPHEVPGGSTTAALFRY